MKKVTEETWKISESNAFSPTLSGHSKCAIDKNLNHGRYGLVWLEQNQWWLVIKCKHFIPLIIKQICLTHMIYTHTHTSMSIKTIKTNENVIDIIGKKRGGAAKWSLTIVGAQFGG